MLRGGYGGALLPDDGVLLPLLPPVHAREVEREEEGGEEGEGEEEEGRTGWAG